MSIQRHLTPTSVAMNFGGSYRSVNSVNWMRNTPVLEDMDFKETHSWIAWLDVLFEILYFSLSYRLCVTSQTYCDRETVLLLKFLRLKKFQRNSRVDNIFLQNEFYQIISFLRIFYLLNSFYGLFLKNFLTFLVINSFK